MQAPDIPSSTARVSVTVEDDAGGQTTADVVVSTQANQAPQIVTNISANIELLKLAHLNGDGHLALDPGFSNYYVGDVLLVDFNEDSYMDAVVAGENHNYAEYFENDGAGNLAATGQTVPT